VPGTFADEQLAAYVAEAPPSGDDVAAMRADGRSGPGRAPPGLDLAVVRDSAGGTLATLACLRLRDEDRQALPALQVLPYANTDLTGSEPSMREKATGSGLDASGVRFFVSQCVPDPGLRADPRVSPLYVPDLSGLRERL